MIFASFFSIFLWFFAINWWLGWRGRGSDGNWVYLLGGKWGSLRGRWGGVSPEFEVMLLAWAFRTRRNCVVLCNTWGIKGDFSWCFVRHWLIKDLFWLQDNKLGESEHINLKVLGQDNAVVQFKIKKHTPLRKLMNAYCDRAVSCYCFCFEVFFLMNFCCLGSIDASCPIPLRWTANKWKWYPKHPGNGRGRHNWGVSATDGWLLQLTPGLGAKGTRIIADNFKMMHISKDQQNYKKKKNNLERGWNFLFSFLTQNNLSAL